MWGWDLCRNPWPSSALDAASMFHQDIVPELRRLLASDDADSVVLLLPPADHVHAAWRLAAIQGLAREAAPLRVNAIVGDAGPGVDEAIAFLADAPGVTGQILVVDGNPGAKG